MESNLPKITFLGDACCGCGACAAKCVKNCIEMVSDTSGFLSPKVDFAVCVDCGACDAVCPVLCAHEKDNLESVIWAKSKNQAEMFASSSGGVFALLAHEVLSAGGGYVFGASWAPDFKSVRHVQVESEDKLDSIMRSKYVQSCVSRTVYESVRGALLDGKQVLLAGTACQVAGVKSYLGKLANASNFLTVDVICHGVPSPMLWEKWTSWRENRAGTSLCDVNMRSKTTGWLSYSSEYKYTEEKDNASVVDRSVFMEDWYMKAFLSNASLRSSCYACPAKRSCGSDITLGVT